MKFTPIVLLIFFYQMGYAQNVIFTNPNLKTYLINENTVDLNGDEIADTLIDTNNDNEIQVSEATAVLNLVLSPGSEITSIQDLQQFDNIKRLTLWGDFGLTEVSRLGLDNLQHIRVSDHNSITDIDLSDLANLNSVYLEGLNGVQSLNLQIKSKCKICG